MTVNDPRLLAAQLALEKLKAAIFSKTTVRPGLDRDRTNALLSELESQLMALKFSYMEPKEMADSPIVASIYEGSKKLYLGYKEALDSGFKPLQRANVLWAFMILSGLKRRFQNSGKKPTHGIDIVAVTIRNITKNNALLTTRCIAGPSDFTIVTNILTLKTGNTLAAAILPPAVVGGVVSEAMFLGPGPMEEKPGTFIDPDDAHTKEVDGMLYNETSRL